MSQASLLLSAPFFLYLALKYKKARVADTTTSTTSSTLSVHIEAVDSNNNVTTVSTAPTHHVPPQTLVVPKKQPKHPIASRTVFTKLISPEHLTLSGIAFGGAIMSFIDIAAGICAFRHVSGPCVTASMDELHFVNPIRGGEIAIVEAKVTRAFNTSLEVSVVVTAENALTGEKRFCCQAFLVFVAMDIAQHKPLPAPGVVPQTEEEQRQFDLADERNKMRTYHRKHVLKRPLSNHDLKKMMDEHGLSETEIHEEPEISKAALSYASLPLPSSSSSVVFVDQTRVEMTEIVGSSHLNMLGFLFGGQAMKWMEQAAWMSATRFAHKNCLTVNVTNMNFHNRSFAGELLLFKAQVNRVFSSSLEVGVRVLSFSPTSSTDILSEDPVDGAFRHCYTAFFTFVAVEDGQLVKHIPHVVPRFPEDIQRYMMAEERRQKRTNSRKQVQQSS